VAHACNPSYSGGRDQEDCIRSQPRQIVLETLSRKTLHKNRAGGVAQGEGPEFKLQYSKKKKKEYCSNISLIIRFIIFHKFIFRSSKFIVLGSLFLIKGISVILGI
jgi:hypothetical protein